MHQLAYLNLADISLLPSTCSQAHAKRQDMGSISEPSLARVSCYLFSFAVGQGHLCLDCFPVQHTSSRSFCVDLLEPQG